MSWRGNFWACPPRRSPWSGSCKRSFRNCGGEAHLLVWDNLESATGIPGTEVQPQLPQEDLELLAGLLKDLRDGKTKALLTSRKKETNWLPSQSASVSLWAVWRGRSCGSTAMRWSGIWA